MLQTGQSKPLLHLLVVLDVTLAPRLLGTWCPATSVVTSFSVFDVLFILVFSHDGCFPGVGGPGQGFEKKVPATSHGRLAAAHSPLVPLDMPIDFLTMSCNGWWPSCLSSMHRVARLLYLALHSPSRTRWPFKPSVHPIHLPSVYITEPAHQDPCFFSQYFFVLLLLWSLASTGSGLSSNLGFLLVNNKKKKGYTT